ncbi:MAG: GTPase domain-containing protein [Planctomycetota bacterium]
MSVPELLQLELLAQVDDLLERLNSWLEIESNWEPLQASRALLRRVVFRVETLRVRLEAPLVVATFGGTGTGKSALINALVGRECTASGRQRPTTTRPILVAHPLTELQPLGLPLESFEITLVDAPALRDIVIVDCPDPDTNEAETAGSNLERLRQMLPHCDVLLYTSTQQKYRSARVVQELSQAASGCRLIFVQTHADLDADIRDDWRSLLAEHYEVPDVFFVDSLRALREQAAGQRPSGDFSRLLDLLSRELGTAQRTQVRRANLLDLVQAALDHCRKSLAEHELRLVELEDELERQRQRMLATMTVRLRDELLASRNLWERRLLGEVAQIWGFSPFSSVLRLYNSLGTLLASATLVRARSSAQLAILGAMQGMQWLNSRRAEQESEDRMQQLASLGLDDHVLREAQLVLSGYVQSARFDSRILQVADLKHLRHEAARVENQFLGDAGRQVEEIISSLARRHSGVFRRACYEILWLAFVSYLIIRIGKNFFWDSVFSKTPILTMEFYLAAGVFLVLWSGLLLMSFTRGLRRGLNQRINQLAVELAQSRLGSGLFPQLESACSDAHQVCRRLEHLALTTTEIRRQIAVSPGLGSARGVDPQRALAAVSE